MRITLDASILVRANARANGPSRELLLLIRQRGDTLVLSPFLITEVRRVLSYPRMQELYRLSGQEIAGHIHELESLAELVDPIAGPSVVRKDPADDPVVFTAVVGQADILCTLDRHFYEPDVLSFCARYGIRVVTDIELLCAMRQGW